MPTVLDPDALLRQVVKMLDHERLDQGLTQRALGELVGITQSSVSKYFRVELHLTVSQFDAMCTALGLKPGQVMAEADRLRNTA